MILSERIRPGVEAARLMDCMIERGIVVRTYDAENGVRYTVPNASLSGRGDAPTTK